MPNQDYPKAMDVDWFLEKEGETPQKKKEPESTSQQTSEDLILNPTTAQMEAQTQAGQQQYLGSLKQQADVSKGAIGEIEKTGQAALAGEREKSGRAFAAQVAQGGGGSLAGMRQSQLSRGIAEGQLMGEYGMQKIAAQRLAAQAQSEYLAEKQKLQKAAYEGQGMAQKEVQAGVQAIKNEFNRMVQEEGGYWSDANKRTMANWIYANYANAETKRKNPALYNAAVSAVDDILAERGDYGNV